MIVSDIHSVMHSPDVKTLYQCRCVSKCNQSWCHQCWKLHLILFLASPLGHRGCWTGEQNLSPIIKAFELLLWWQIAWHQSYLVVVVGYCSLWCELNVGHCTNIMSRGRGHLPFGRLTWMLQVGQNKGIECNEMRNLLLIVIVVTKVKRNKEQTALMDDGNYFPHATTRWFSVTSTGI